MPKFIKEACLDTELLKTFLEVQKTRHFGKSSRKPLSDPIGRQFSHSPIGTKFRGAAVYPLPQQYPINLGRGIAVTACRSSPQRYRCSQAADPESTATSQIQATAVVTGISCACRCKLFSHFVSKRSALAIGFVDLPPLLARQDFSCMWMVW